MKLPLYQVDAFASRPFEGNPAAVCPLEQWLPDGLMQAIASENNLSETAFFVPENDGFRIRWFTPRGEVDLCGHATLAAAYTLFHHLGHAANAIGFDSRSGPLAVTRDGDRLTLDFPAQPPVPCATPGGIVRAFDAAPVDCLQSEDLIVVFATEAEVRSAQPDMRALEALTHRGVAITAPSENWDFVVRFFAPKYGIPEDPVTGSAYTQLAPYWASRLGSRRFRVKQVSPRGGELTCEPVNDRVLISGRAVLYLEGTIFIG